MRYRPFLVAIILLAACASDRTNDRGAAKGGKRYGGIFNVNEVEPLRAFFPLQLTQAAAHRVAAQVYQGLVKLDQRTLAVVPCLAERWETDASGTVWTFHLRQGVHFHDDPAFSDGEGRELTANDVVDCFTAICTGGEENQMFWLFQDRVLGANEHHAATLEGTPGTQGVKGLEVVDARTVRITLEQPVPNFLQILAHQGCWIWPHELRDNYRGDLLKHAIGTGPFHMKTFRPGEAMVLERNPRYWERDVEGNALPFLDGVRVTYVADKNKELDEFLKGHITCVIEPPVDRLGILRDSVSEGGEARFTVQRIPQLSAQFFGFCTWAPPFNDARIRRAFSLALDRKALVDTVLRGVAVAAERGLVPPGMALYPYERVTPTGFLPDSARALLAAAGYPGGKGFPGVSLQVNGDGFAYVQVADAVQVMLERVLGVSVAVSVLPASQHYEKVDAGRALFWRQGWIADYPDPENFLALLYGRNAVLDTGASSYMNTSRYADPRFDTLYARAQHTLDPAARMDLMARAERVAMDEAVVAPVYHENNIRLLAIGVHDFPINAMEYRDLGAVWIDP